MTVFWIKVTFTAIVSHIQVHLQKEANIHCEVWSWSHCLLLDPINKKEMGGACPSTACSLSAKKDSLDPTERARLKHHMFHLSHSLMAIRYTKGRMLVIC